jgi:2,3,4,5-tetrahydropyridine-2-carboxylate N-succinyltransferase
MSPPGGVFRFYDKRTIPPRHLGIGHGVRIVPGGSIIRRGSYVAPGVVCMPPMFVNAGAWVGRGTMIDSHALVGSCAQIGERVHLSAAAQIGGVLEPVNAAPVIIEDDAVIGGNCGVYEGTVALAGGARGRDRVDARHAGLRPRQRKGHPRLSESPLEIQFTR